MNHGNLKRVNVLIKPEHHEMVMSRGLSLSGLVRDLLEDWFRETRITVSVSKETKALYDSIISNFGAGDGDLEPYLIQALDQMLEDKTQEIGDLREQLRAPSRRNR